MRHTKFIVMVIPFSFLLLSFLGCSQPGKAMIMDKSNTGNHQNVEETDTILTIQGLLTEADAISFGNTYYCQVKQVLSGHLKEKEIRILVMVEDRYESFFKEHSSQGDVEITFVKNEENVPYQLMPLTGFVNQKMTSWKVKQVRAKQDTPTLDIGVKKGSK
jgi:hypothetical protein